MAGNDSTVAIGFRVKTGRATTVILAGPAAAPRVLERRQVQLCDPAIPESFQPYHAELELAPEKAARIVPRALDAVNRVSLDVLRGLAAEVRASHRELRGVALVAGSATDPESIRNPHMRAHAREGQLFPRALATAARTLSIPSLSMVEGEALARGADALGLPAAALKSKVAELGREVGSPWGSEEKAACVAAWIALGGARLKPRGR